MDSRFIYEIYNQKAVAMGFNSLEHLCKKLEVGMSYKTAKRWKRGLHVALPATVERLREGLRLLR